MHFLFVDESGTPAKPGQQGLRFFTFGGIVIPVKQWRSVRQKFLGLKRRMKYRGEVKWRYFAPHNADPENPMLEWDMVQRNVFRSELFSIIKSFKSMRLICGVSEIGSAYKLGNVNNQEDVYFGTYKVVTERFQYFLQDLERTSGNPTYGIIVADHRNGRDDSLMREHHERLVSQTTRFTSTYSNFVETIFFSPSHMSAGMQLADMVAGAVQRYFEHNDDQWIKQIQPSFRTNPKTGGIDGYGIARFPKNGWTGPIYP